MTLLEIRHGHCIDEMRKMSEASVHCVVTSPPYWGLRDYKIPPVEWQAVTHAPMSGCDPRTVAAWTGQLGLEPTPEMFVAHIIAVFREVRRVMRPDATCWVNFGDSYASSPGKHKETDKVGAKQSTNPGSAARGDKCGGGLKQKDLIGIPWRVALALQADGWYLRSDIIWSKANPMPSSVTDRPATSHEYIFLLTKSPTYFFDMEAIKEPVTGTAAPRMSKAALNEIRENRELGMSPVESNPNGHGVNPKARKEQFNTAATSTFKTTCSLPVSSRNKRSVWTLPSQAYPESHYATFPPDLIRPCILAGTSQGGCCAACGAPLERVIEKGKPDRAHQLACGGDKKGEYHGKATKDFLGSKAQDASATKARILAGMVEKKTVGWKPTCKCEAATAPCTVLDPFGGSGTTGQVALEYGRRCVLIELGAQNVELIKGRTNVTPGML